MNLLQIAAANTMRKAIDEGWLSKAVREERAPSPVEATMAGLMVVISTAPYLPKISGVLSEMTEEERERLVETMTMAAHSIMELHAGLDLQPDVFDLLPTDVQAVVEANECERCPLHEYCDSPAKRPVTSENYRPLSFGPNEAKIRAILGSASGEDNSPVANASAGGGAVLH